MDTASLCFVVDPSTMLLIAVLAKNVGTVDVRRDFVLLMYSSTVSKNCSRENITTTLAYNLEELYTQDPLIEHMCHPLPAPPLVWSICGLVIQELQDAEHTSIFLYSYCHVSTSDLMSTLYSMMLFPNRILRV